MNEQISFSEIERLSRIALDTGDINRLESIILPLLREEDKTRSAAENLFVYRTLGTMYREKKQYDESLTAYEQAHSYDPRDLDTLQILVEEELKKSPVEVNVNRLMEILLFHRSELKSNLVMRIFKMIGDAYVVSEELVRARECYEKALDARPGDMDLINALLKVSEASGDEQAIAKSREKLLDSMTNPESRAAVLVSIGDDLLNRKKDEKAALAMYEEALAECAQSTAAHQRILVIAEHEDDWERCLNALNALVSDCTDGDEKCKYILKMAWIYKEKLNNTKHAVELFNDVLDIQPDQLEVFQGIISLLQSQNDSLGIEANYERMIERHRAIEPMNVKLMAVLCKNLGELRVKLNNMKGAAVAYQAVSSLYPDNVNFHIILAKLYALDDETLEQAVFENREILRLAPDRLDAVADLARCYRRQQKFDESLCIYRVLDVLGMNDDEGKEIVGKFADSDIPLISSRFTDDDWSLIIPKTLDQSIMRILQICVPIISECFANELDRYGIDESAQIDLSENSVFAKALRNESKVLGFVTCPEAYRCDRVKGLMNAYLSENAFLVSPNILRGRTDHELAFVTSKALMLMRSENYLLQLGMKAIELILQIVFKVACPQLNIELDRNQQKVARVLERGLSDADRSTIVSRIQTLSQQKGGINIKLYMESVEDFSNRVGLLFCDNPAVVEKMLAEETRSISTRTIRDRVGSLLVWALSEDYTELRRRLNIALKAR